MINERHLARGGELPEPAFPDRLTIARASREADDPRFLDLAKDLVDPANMHESTASLFHKHRISINKFLERWRDYHHAIGIMSVVAKVPELYGDMFENTRNVKDLCPTCKGRTKVENRTCPRCRGKGEITLPGDHATRKLLFEIMGLITPARVGRHSVTIQNAVGFGPPTQPLEHTTALVGQVLSNDTSDGTTDPK